jgi:hypothetical protein
MPDGSRLPTATAATLRADPLADDTIARIFGAAGGNGVPSDAIALVNREMATWTDNGMLPGWRAAADVPAPVAAALEDYVRHAHALPAWAEPARIARAEHLFMDIGMLSCTLLFCASLPECYVMPDLADVLHAAGQLEAHTDYRVRSTAAMIFPVMLHGGLAGTAGAGVAQVLKVRLIHATIRRLVLRGGPAQAAAGVAVPPLPAAGAGMHQVLHALGWDAAARGLPCNQQELAYTLLTFGYVYLRALRRLGLALPRADEEATLHAWNVVGHVLGIERALMADTMEEAAALFERFQAEGERQPRNPDPRPALAAALLAAMEREIPLPLLRTFPLQLTRYLCGKRVARTLGLARRTALPARLLFLAFLGVTRGVDAAVRLFVPGFSLSRMFTRVLGYRLTAHILMDQTRPLRLPSALVGQVGATLDAWRTDPKAPRWLNRLEARLSGRGGQEGPRQ